MYWLLFLSIFLTNSVMADELSDILEGFSLNEKGEVSFTVPKKYPIVESSNDDKKDYVKTFSPAHYQLKDASEDSYMVSYKNDKASQVAKVLLDKVKIKPQLSYVVNLTRDHKIKSITFCEVSQNGVTNPGYCNTINHKYCKKFMEYMKEIDDKNGVEAFRTKTDLRTLNTLEKKLRYKILTLINDGSVADSKDLNFLRDPRMFHGQNVKAHTINANGLENINQSVDKMIQICKLNETKSIFKDQRVVEPIAEETSTIVPES